MTKPTIRYALLYTDGSLNVLTKPTREEALAEAQFNYAHDESIRPRLVRVRIEFVTVEVAL